MRIRTTQIPATEIDIERIKVSSGRKITIVPFPYAVKDPHQFAAKMFAMIYGDAERDTPIRMVRQTTRGYIFET
jgi:hypothetical protein